MPRPRKHSSPPLHPLFQAVLPAALRAAFDGAPDLIELDPRGGMALGRLRLRPADDRRLSADLADAARQAGIGAMRLPDGAIAIPDLDGTFARAFPFADRQSAARALALARGTLLLKAGASALARAEARRRASLARRVARAVRLAAPAIGVAMRTLACQLELACHLHARSPHAASPLMGLLAERNGAGGPADAPFDRLRLRRLARRETPLLQGRAEAAARDARLDAFLARLEAPRARARSA